MSAPILPSPTPRLTTTVAALLLAAACGGAATGGQPPAPTPTPAAAGAATAADTADLVPPGFGSLRQDDIAIKIGVRNAIQVKVLPIDERVTRLLAPDSWRAMRDLKEGRREQVAAIARRFGVRAPTLLYVSFFGLAPDARFSPTELVVNSGGREFRPLDIVPLTMGFGEQRLRQRETQSAIYVMDEGIDVLQPMTVTLEGVSNASWGATVRTLERERALVRSRASGGRP